MVSILLLENILTILHGLTNFHVQSIEEDTCDHVDINIEQVHFNFDGQLKYCPQLLSPMFNFPRATELKKQSDGSPRNRHQTIDHYKELNLKIIRYLTSTDKILERFLQEDSVFGSCLMPKI